MIKKKYKNPFFRNRNLLEAISFERETTLCQKLEDDSPQRISFPAGKVLLLHPGMRKQLTVVDPSTNAN